MHITIMAQKAFIVVFGLLLCMGLVHCQISPIAEEVMRVMDTSVSPCVDFFNYSCGGWLKNNEIPADKSRIDRSFEQITDRNNKLLLGIAASPSSGKVHEFYTACMDTRFIQNEGAMPLHVIWSQFAHASEPEYLSTNLAVTFRNAYTAFFSLGAEVDSSDPSKIIYSLRQGGLSLPDPSLYQDKDIFPKFVTHIENMFRLAGDAPEQAQRNAKDISAFEAKIAQFTLTPDQLFDPFKTFNKMPWTDLFILAPRLQFPGFITKLDLHLPVPITLDVPNYFSSLSTLVAATDPAVINAYLRWRIMNSMASRLSSQFVNENFAFFGTALTGVTVQPPRNRTCVQAATDAMPELVGRLYTEVAFPESSKQAATAIFQSIIAAFKINSQKLEWMDPITMERAMEKVDKVLTQIGYPEKPSNYTHLRFTQSYSHNVRVAAMEAYRADLRKAGGPSDRHAWFSNVPASMVNAFYEPLYNKMVFPAGILQTPFFNPDFPACMNYGGIGMVGGHELTHGLDSQGRDYNGDGKLVDWWEPQTSEQFQKRVDCIIAQYSKFSPLPGFFVNGNLTQGENIADAGGLKSTHSAYLLKYPNDAKLPSIVPNLNNEQLLFVGFAQTWCSKLTPAAIKQRLLTDPHSPPRFRVNGPVSNLPAFAQAFNCPAGSPMNPPARCQIW